MMSDDNIDNDILISLVEERPVLWDKTLDSFKDRNKTRDAWREICCALKSNFEDMEDKDKNAFGKDVTKRWSNLRDAFSKSKKKVKESKSSGAGAPNIKKYVYADQMQFLNKLYQSREVAESLEAADNNEDNDAILEGPLHRQETTPIRDTNQRGPKKRRHPDEVELKMMKALEEPQSPHISFIKGLLPHLNKFTDGEVLEFQMGVLEVISKINTKRHTIAQSQLLPQPSTSYYTNNYPFPQTSHLNYQPQHPQHFHSQQQHQIYQPQQQPQPSLTSSEIPSASTSPAASVYSDTTLDFS